MKIEIKKSLFEQVLSQMQPFLEKKDISQITSHIYLEASNNLQVRATDYETGLKTDIENANIIKEGKATANGKKLLEIVRILKDKDITVETKENNLLITQDSSKFKLPMFNPEEFPNFPNIDSLPKIDIEAQIFVNSLKKIAPAIDTNNPKYELNGALIDIKEDKINFVSTDTKRLALVTLDKKLEKELSIIIPKKAILESQKLFFDELTIFYDEVNLIITNKNYFFFTKLINGKFPDYERIIPKSLNHTVSLPKDKMIEAIKQITIVSNNIKLTFLKSKILFKSLSEENIEAQTEMEIETPFEEEFTMAVNSRYILDFLANIEDNEFKMGINDEDMPFKLENGNFIKIIMPIVI
jgi:DNA polymerase-3 subunit beta